MKNLLELKSNELRKHADYLHTLDLNDWRIKSLTTSKNESFIKNKIEKDCTKKLNEFNAFLESLAQSKEVEKIIITIQWKKSKMWGSNPEATATVDYTDNTRNKLNSGSIGGCGYDKQSTALANILNQVDYFIYKLTSIKEKNSATHNHELFGYGSGYNITPSFEGGVGVTCYPRILEKIGYKMSTLVCNDDFDAYEIVKQ